ncbi:MAG: hypothetical protein H6733_03995 [Alphaproteobacteria bacterium]|nr:hypothetical protein [Alphaproteobacteria bacterium]
MTLSSSSRRLPGWPALSWRRVARWWLCAWMVLGLLPGAEEIVESIVHLVHDGHLPHSEAHAAQASSEHCPDDAEHGCTPLSHHCGCCVSLAALPPSDDVIVVPTAVVVQVGVATTTVRGPPVRFLEPLRRPPIA